VLNVVQVCVDGRTCLRGGHKGRACIEVWGEARCVGLADDDADAMAAFKEIGQIASPYPSLTRKHTVTQIRWRGLGASKAPLVADRNRCADLSPVVQQFRLARTQHNASIRDWLA
jgi:hypothetical protein